MPSGSPAITRVQIRNYKSIRQCDVHLERLTVLVGPNGSGKSNFLDALRFVSHGLTRTLDLAIRERGGISSVRRHSSGHPHNFSLQLELRLPAGQVAEYGFTITSDKAGGFRVKHEKCSVFGTGFGSAAGDASFEVSGTNVKTTLATPLPAPAPDRLFLVAASGMREFRPVFDLLTTMGFYNLVPAVIRVPQQPSAGTILERDGGNLASMLGHLDSHNPARLERIIEYLRAIAPGVESVRRKSVGSHETLEFRLAVEGSRHPWKFDAINMSDGTLRAVGVLAALLQRNGRPPSLVAVEEPESALHPAAVGVLLDAIRDATEYTQVLATSHSPDLLDRGDVGVDNLLAVAMENGVSTIAPVGGAGRDALRESLFTAGELLRMRQLEPEVTQVQLELPGS